MAGIVYGEGSKVTPAARTRAILPQAAFLQLVDAVFSIYLQGHQERFFPLIASCVVAALPGIRVLDILT